jgi:hypothetical protein
MWALHESYDPATQVLYLDLVAEPAMPPVHDGLAEPKLLGTFEEAAEARKFTDIYLKSLAYEKDKVVSEVRCGEHRAGGCNGPGKPCSLGLDAYRCKAREDQ